MLAECALFCVLTVLLVLLAAPEAVGLHEGGQAAAAMFAGGVW